MTVDFSNPLLVFALEQESGDLFTSWRTLYTGVGKVQAAYKLALEIAKERPSVVVNLGTAGSKKFKAGAVVNATSFVQRDMDVTPLGFAAFQTPFSDIPQVLKYAERLEGLPEAICGTGDNFAVNEDFGGGLYDIVDMEAFALALLCRDMDISFTSLKYISDGADGASHQDWGEALEAASKALKSALDRFI